MINVTYIPASQRLKLDSDPTKKVYNLKADNLKLKEANFHTWEFVPVGIENAKGLRITRFKQEPKGYETQLYIRGSDMERASLIDELHSFFEQDLVYAKPALLIWGDWSIDCFIRSSSTYPDGFETVNDIEIYCPYPQWSYTVTKTFLKSEQRTDQDSQDLDYNYDYNYDYAGGTSGTEMWNINHFAPVEFEMTIFGACVDPRVIINGHIYQVYTTLTSNERLVIDSKNKTIKKYSGTAEINLFDWQNKQEDIFQPIEAGMAQVNWANTFNFEIKAYMESAEPKWSTTGRSFK